MENPVPLALRFARPIQRTLWFTFWVCIVGLSLWFFYDQVLVYFRGFRSNVFGHSFFHNQAWVVMHLFGGSLALLLGPVQFWQPVRNRYLPFHKLSGKIYMTGVLLIGLSAMWLAPQSVCSPCRVSLFILALLVLLSTAFAWRAIRAKNIKAHRQFM